MLSYRNAYLVAVFVGVVVGYTSASIEDSLQNLDINSLPDRIQNITTNFKVEDAEQVLSDKCKKNSGNDDAYKNVKAASEQAQTCVKDIIDWDVLNKEMEAAKPTGDLDVVFKKYCQQSPALKKCIFDLTDSLDPCLETKEIETKNMGTNITESLFNFICFKDGDRIALFIAEGGPDCLNSSSADIKTCVETTFGKKIDTETLELESLPLLLLETEECDKFRTLQTCVVKAMDRCAESTPSNVIDSLFNFIRRQTPCQELETKKKAEPKTSSSSMITATILPIVALAIHLCH